MNENKKTNDVKDLLVAKKEAKKKTDMLTDEELEIIAGGSGGQCPRCGATMVGTSCFFCGYSSSPFGDVREGMDEALVDIAGLTEAGDGFC